MVEGLDLAGFDSLSKETYLGQARHRAGNFLSRNEPRLSARRQASQEGSGLDLKRKGSWPALSSNTHQGWKQTSEEEMNEGLSGFSSTEEEAMQNYRRN